MVTTLQQFIVETFSETELLILCESDEQLQKATAEFSDSMGLGEKVRRLIGFCKRRRLSSVLWEKVKAERYEQWLAYQMPENESNSQVTQVLKTSKEVGSIFREIKAFESLGSQTMANRPLKVFLCHSSADKPEILKLYEFLRTQGIKPWLDSVDLIPGQQWQLEISQAIKTSDVILICLSKSSVSKEGYVQKEIKFALDKALEIPEEHIFLIPARLEECDLPYSLQHYQWVDLFAESGYSKLIQSLKMRTQQLNRTPGE